MSISDEERLQRLVTNARLLESYLNEVSARQSMVARAILESNAALEAIKGFSSQGNSDLLVPIGGGLFLKALAPPPDVVIVNVGADVAVEKTREEAIAYMEERVKDLEKATSVLESQKAELTSRVNSERAAIGRLIEKQRKASP